MRTRRHPWTLALAALVVVTSGAIGAAVGRAGAAPAGAPEAPASADATTQTVPVVTPVGRGDTGPGDGFGTVVGSAEVPLPDETAPDDAHLLDLGAGPVPVPAAVAAALGPVPPDDVLPPPGLAGDPGAGAPATGGDAPGGAADAAGAVSAVDPCAAPGDAPEGCPEGVRATVLASRTPPPLEVFAVADPPVREPGEAGPVPVAWCPPAERPGPGGARVAVVTTAPADVEVVVHAADDPPGPGRAERTHRASTDADARGAWEAALEAGRPTTERWHLISHCLWLTDLETGRAHAGRVQVTDAFGRTAVAPLPRVVSDATAGLVEPPLRVEPLTDTRVRVTVPHTSAQHADVRAWPVTPGTEPGCVAPAGTRELWGTEPVTTEVPEDEAVARGHDPAFDRVTREVLGVPPGATVVVCVRVYDTAGPSWDWDRPERATAVLVDAPAVPVPTISLEALELERPGDRAHLRIDVGMSGLGCGSWSGATDVAVPTTLCDPAARAELLAQGMDRRADVRVTYEPPGGAPASTAALLETAVRACGVGCTRETEWYRLPLPRVRVSSGLCGGSGDCTPPTRDRILGTALLRVDWSGAGGRGWSVGAPVDATRPREVPALPQLDVFVTPAVTGTRAEPVVVAALRADRPVTWAVRWVGCTREEGAARAASTTPAQRFEARLTGVCAGGTGAIEVTLTDAEGRTSVWGPSPEEYGDHVWARGLVVVPDVPTRTDVAVAVTPRDQVAVVEHVRVTLDGRPVPWPAGTERACADRSGFTYQRLGFDEPLPDHVRVHVSVLLREADGWSGAGPDRCSASPAPPRVVTFAATVARADLLAGPVRLEAGPDAAAGVVLTLTGRP
jgi:hypothetical protein